MSIDVDLVISFRASKKTTLSNKQKEEAQKAEAQYSRLLETLTYGGLKAVGRRGDSLRRPRGDLSEESRLRLSEGDLRVFLLGEERDLERARWLGYGERDPDDIERLRPDLYGDRRLGL